jgi:hypothetical protein
MLTSWLLPFEVAEKCVVSVLEADTATSALCRLATGSSPVAATCYRTESNNKMQIGICLGCTVFFLSSVELHLQQREGKSHLASANTTRSPSPDLHGSPLRNRLHRRSATPDSRPIRHRGSWGNRLELRSPAPGGHPACQHLKLRSPPPGARRPLELLRPLEVAVSWTSAGPWSTRRRSRGERRGGAEEVHHHVIHPHTEVAERRRPCCLVPIAGEEGGKPPPRLLHLLLPRRPAPLASLAQRMNRRREEMYLSISSLLRGILPLPFASSVGSFPRRYIGLQGVRFDPLVRSIRSSN